MRQAWRSAAPGDTYRRIRIESVFGKMTVLVTDGHLPYPYSRELTGYEVANLADALGSRKPQAQPFWSMPSIRITGTWQWCNFPAAMSQNCMLPQNERLALGCNEVSPSISYLR
jgi:hypothetical protein